ncbi:hypothetical protein [Endothiovibrio diazotrophicus]
MKKRWGLIAPLLALLMLFNVGYAAGAPDYGACPPGAVGVPVSNAEIRFWYNQQVVVIPALNREWIADQQDPRERAERAYEIRHNARINARYFMRDKQEVALLHERDEAKYGNPDGPTFDELVKANRAEGLIGDAVFEAIVDSSSRTSAEFNQLFGLPSGGGH